VLGSKPPPRARIRKGQRVLLIPSLGPEFLAVPNVEGKTEKRAKRAITDAGFVPKVRTEFNDTVDRGKVIRQSPQPPVNLEKGKRVEIVVSKGPAPVEIPPVEGKTKDEAKATLEALRFTVTETEEFSTAVKKGDAIRTDPPAGDKVQRGSEVTLIVSKG